MRITLAALVGLILGLVVGGLLTARIVKAKMEPKFTEDSHGCGKILPAYSVTVEGIATPSASTNDHDKIGYGTKLGGEPDWIQGVDIPVCRMCKIPMLFVAQIDSIAMADKKRPLGKDSKTGKEIQEFMFGDAGMVYVFTCLDCGEVAGVGQCY